MFSISYKIQIWIGSTYPETKSSVFEEKKSRNKRDKPQWTISLFIFQQNFPFYFLMCNFKFCGVMEYIKLYATIFIFKSLLWLFARVLVGMEPQLTCSMER